MLNTDKTTQKTVKMYKFYTKKQITLKLNPTDTQFRDPQHKLSRGENAYSNYAFDDGPVCEAFILKNAKNVEFVESPWS